MSIISLNISLIIISTCLSIFIFHPLVEGVIAKGGLSDNTPSELMSFLDKFNFLNNIQLDNIAIFWSGLGGAIVGAISSSVLQHIFLKWNTTRKEHFVDIKKEVIEPLLNSISKTPKLEFLINDLPELSIYAEAVMIELQVFSRMNIEIGNVLWKDCFENHYPYSYGLLIDTLNKFQNSKDKESTLLANLEIEVNGVINKLSKSLDEIVAPKCSEKLAASIFIGTWHHTRVHSTINDGSAYIYFSLKKDDTIPYESERDDFMILQVKGNDFEKNEERAEEIKSIIITKIEEISKNSASDINDYRANIKLFQSSKDKLLAELLRIRYSTNLKIVRHNSIRKKCILLR
ncbi:MAG: hypothetical protein AB7V56_06930 [Candidatus Nitrosocosmicus sp.]